MKYLQPLVVLGLAGPQGWVVRGLGADAAWDGDFKLSGPSLAAAGEPVGLTLPTTPPFAVQGHIARRGPQVIADIADARIGRSELSGHFGFEPQARPRPMLRGQLNGRALWLADLGPAIGTGPTAAPAAANTRVLPDRPFDLPSLSRMDADLRVDLDRLVLGHPKLESLQPLRGHLTLRDSVLTLDDLDARLARVPSALRILVAPRSGAAEAARQRGRARRSVVCPGIPESLRQG